eukprot:gene14695-biopygen8123
MRTAGAGAGAGEEDGTETDGYGKEADNDEDNDGGGGGDDGDGGVFPPAPVGRQPRRRADGTPMTRRNKTNSGHDLGSREPGAYPAPPDQVALRGSPVVFGSHGLAGAGHSTFVRWRARPVPSIWRDRIPISPKTAWGDAVIILGGGRLQMWPGGPFLA